MKSNKKTLGLFLVMFLGVFWFIYKPIGFDIKGLKRFVLSVKLALIITFGLLSPADAKDSGFLPGAEGFTPSISRPSRSSHGYSGSTLVTGASGQNPSGGGNGGNSNAGSEAGSCSSNPTPKPISKVMHSGLGSPQKTKKQKALEKMKRELEESIREEDKLNAQRKSKITLIIKDGIKFFAPNDQLRDKYHHAPNLDSPIPETLGDAELARLADPTLYRERLNTFQNREILPEAYVEQYGQDLRLHVLNPDTKIIKGTLGANREANGDSPKKEGYHLYNNSTGFNAFFDKNGRRYRTSFKTNRNQKNDIKNNSNMM